MRIFEKMERFETNERVSGSDQKRLDQAARAAWLAYVQGLTQDEIAGELNVSRQNVQRLIALATSMGLFKFRLDHPLSECLVLGQKIRERYRLRHVEVAPGSRKRDDDGLSASVFTGRYIENLLTQKVPLVLGLGTGRTLRAAVAHVPSMEQPQHKIVSLVGNVAPDGRATPYDVVMRLCDRVGAQCYPLPMPVITDTAEERALLQSQRGFRALTQLAENARTWIVGLSAINWNSTLRLDGFIDESELTEIMEAGGIGEILGWAFDYDGKPITTKFADRLTAIRLAAPIPAHRTIIAAAAGREKVPAILAALRGSLINGLITDEATALAILESPAPP